jgi:hypothetical protein
LLRTSRKVHDVDVTIEVRISLVLNRDGSIVGAIEESTVAPEQCDLCHRDPSRAETTSAIDPRPPEGTRCADRRLISPVPDALMTGILSAERADFQMVPSSDRARRRADQRGGVAHRGCM